MKKSIKLLEIDGILYFGKNEPAVPVRDIVNR